MLGAAGMQRLDSTERVRLYCGVLPQNRNLPFGYKIAFSFEGLIGEYEDAVHEIQGGEVIEREALDPIEPIYVEGIGALEAFPTSGGAGTSVDLYPGVLQEYAYRTLRYPGHALCMRWLRDVGMWSREPLGEGERSPLEIFASQMESALSLPEEREIAITLAEAEGVRDGVHLKVRATVIHPQNLGDTFTAMEWLTGIGISIPTIHLCKNGVGETGLKAGVSQLEIAMNPQAFLHEIERRRVNVVWSEERVD
jgi:lysine 6-dehydrogenase